MHIRTESEGWRNQPCINPPPLLRPANMVVPSQSQHQNQPCIKPALKNLNAQGGPCAANRKHAPPLPAQNHPTIARRLVTNEITKQAALTANFPYIYIYMWVGHAKVSREYSSKEKKGTIRLPIPAVHAVGTGVAWHSFNCSVLSRHSGCPTNIYNICDNACTLPRWPLVYSVLYVAKRGVDAGMYTHVCTFLYFLPQVACTLIARTLLPLMTP